MSFLDRLHEANVQTYSGFRPFRVSGRRVGCVRDGLAERLTRHPDVFTVDGRGVRLSGRLDDPEARAEERTTAVAGVIEALREAHALEGWRDERYAVRPLTGGPVLLEIERAAVGAFGIRAHAVHVNGFVRDGSEMVMWVARRAADKPTYPGELDHIVAGGLPVGIGLADNVVKECAEEAGIDEPLARRARPTGIVTYLAETSRGLRPDVIHCYDLEVPASFRPVNRDGEVAGFELWPLERVAQTVRETTAYKFNCALVIIDFLLRHGRIGPDDPDYAALVTGLRGPLPSPPPGW